MRLTTQRPARAGMLVLMAEEQEQIGDLLDSDPYDGERWLAVKTDEKALA